MKIVEAAKLALDSVRARVKSDGSGVDTVNVMKSMHPIDEIALEEAVKLKESSFANDIIAISILAVP